MMNSLRRRRTRRLSVEVELTSFLDIYSFSLGIFAVSARGKVTDICEEVCERNFIGRIFLRKYRHSDCNFDDLFSCCVFRAWNQQAVFNCPLSAKKCDLQQALIVSQGGPNLAGMTVSPWTQSPTSLIALSPLVPLPGKLNHSFSVCFLSSTPLYAHRLAPSLMTFPRRFSEDIERGGRKRAFLSNKRKGD
ncbi:hypothetical protein DPX16_15909 [Anabarilius grahami]|uniref:Uncharacterized protein n=1 Tax=Anabarilius grahami TaxID=495550 RepID=A0A3N0YTQ0_ANAGA|nr:hypothetical protein DPX16_15909 [Anabarilius grahami]